MTYVHIQELLNQITIEQSNRKVKHNGSNIILRQYYIPFPLENKFSTVFWGHKNGTLVKNTVTSGRSGNNLVTISPLLSVGSWEI